MDRIQKIAKVVAGVLIALFVKEAVNHNREVDLAEIDWRSMRVPLHNQNPHPEDQKHEYPKDLAFEIRAYTSASSVSTTLTRLSTGIKGDERKWVK